MARINSYREILQVLRPKQWLKNAFVLAPILFSGLFIDYVSVALSLITFLTFCLISSAVYILNDINDREIDRSHPSKRKTRPIANGSLEVKVAVYLLLSLLVSVGYIICVVQPEVAVPIVGYFVLNVLYTFKVKEIVILDIMSIALGFVLRVWAGALAIGVELSHWMLVTTLFLALYLAAVKRRQELLWPGKSIRRPVLRYYTLGLIDKYALISSICAFVFYTLFIILDRPQLILTIPFVFFCILRYWFLVEVQGQGESPADVMIKDKQILIAGISWVILSAYLLSGGALL